MKSEVWLEKVANVGHQKRILPFNWVIRDAIGGFWAEELHGLTYIFESLLLYREKTLGGQDQHQGDQVGDSTVIQVEGGGGDLLQGSSWEGDEKCLEPGQIFNTEPAALSYGLGVVSKKRGVKDNSKIFGLSY